ncbi:MAG: V-type ATP synthase subunit E family protein [Candidatus Omnitrophota bacterium]
MSLESIIQHILDEAKGKAQEIISTAKEEARQLIHGSREEANQLYLRLLEEEELILMAQKEKLLVAARLESKKNLLAARHDLIDAVFVKLEPLLKKERFKKEQVSQHKIEVVPEEGRFYLDSLKLQYQSEVARILFPDA